MFETSEHLPDGLGMSAVTLFGHEPAANGQADAERGSEQAAIPDAASAQRTSAARRLVGEGAGRRLPTQIIAAYEAARRKGR